MVFFCSRYLGAIECPAQKIYRFIVNLSIHGVGVAVFATVSEAELGGIFPGRRCSVGDLGDQGKRAQRFGAYARHSEKRLKVAGFSFVGLQKNFFDGLGAEVSYRDFMMRWQRKCLQFL